MSFIDSNKLLTGKLNDVLRSGSRKSYSTFLMITVNIISSPDNATPEKLTKLLDPRCTKAFELFDLLDNNGFVIKTENGYDVSPLLNYVQPEYEDECYIFDDDDVLKLSPSSIRKLKKECGEFFIDAYHAANVYKIKKLQKNECLSTDSYSLVLSAYKNKWWLSHKSLNKVDTVFECSSEDVEF